MGSLATSFKVVSGVVGVLFLICALRTIVLQKISDNWDRGLHSTRKSDTIELTNERWNRFREALKIKTVTHDLPGMKKFLKYVTEAHPSLFRSKLVDYEIVNGYSLLIRVEGGDKRLLPYLLCAHIDVVPVDESEWATDPFNATEDEEKSMVYARGAIDDKGNLMAHLAALEALLREGTKPRRSFYLAYGHDEEVFGPDGAPEVAKALKRRGVEKVHFVLDEGLLVMKEMIGRNTKKVAMIGVTEKGMMTLNLSVSVKGGHSSMPPAENSMSILSGAVKRLLSNPMDGQVDQLMQEFSESLASELWFPLNVMAANLWLFKPIWWRVLVRVPTIEWFVRTTTAVTVFRAGERFNVVSPTAWAVVNHRVHSLDSFEKVLDHDRRVINDDRVKIKVLNASHVHPISPFDRSSSLSFQVLADTIEESFEDTIIAPAPLIGNTDTRCYLHLTENVYRFSPIAVTKEEASGVHSRNEALSKGNFKSMINFYYRLMKNADRTSLRTSDQRNTEL